MEPPECRWRVQDGEDKRWLGEGREMTLSHACVQCTALTGQKWPRHFICGPGRWSFCWRPFHCIGVLDEYRFAAVERSATLVGCRHGEVSWRGSRVLSGPWLMAFQLRLRTPMFLNKAGVQVRGCVLEAKTDRQVVGMPS